MKKDWIEKYNIMAVAIRLLIDHNCTQKEINACLAKSDEWHEKSRKNADKIIKNPGELSSIFSSYDSQESFCLLIVLINHLDGLLDFSSDTSISYFMTDPDIVLSPMVKLNTNSDITKIELFPRYPCTWKKSKVYNGIKSIMQRYLYIDTNQNKEYKAQHYILKENPLSGKKFLRIAVSPYTNAHVLGIRDICNGKQQNVFQITGIGSDNLGDNVRDGYYLNQQGMIDRLKACIQKASEQDIDILIFPEMLGSPAIVQEGLLKMLELEYSTPEFAKPFMVLFPTVWAKNAEKCTNSLDIGIAGAIADGEGVSASFVQQKQNAYLKREESFSGKLEDITGNGIVNVLHIPALGRVVFPICADFLTDDYRKFLMEELNPSLILCPSFSQGFDEFIQSTALSGLNRCHIIWCNSCAAIHHYGEWSPEKFNYNDICCAGIAGCNREYAPIKPTAECGGKCSKKYCLFYIDIPIEKKKTSSCSWKHLY